MNKLKYALSLLAGTLVMMAAAAETIPFRGGDVLAAELTRSEPAIRNLGSFDFEFEFTNRVYALVTVKLTAGRTLGTHDYSIEIVGRQYPCVAIRAGNGEFDAGVREFNPVSQSELYGMLFIIDGNLVGVDKVKTFDLKCNAPGRNDTFALPFANLGTRTFTAADRIAASGAFQLEK